MTTKCEGVNEYRDANDQCKECKYGLVQEDWRTCLETQCQEGEIVLISGKCEICEEYTIPDGLKRNCQDQCDWTRQVLIDGICSDCDGEIISKTQCKAIDEEDIDDEKDRVDTDPGDPQKEAESEDSGAAVIFLVVLGACLVIGFILFMIYYYQKKKPDGEAADTSAAEVSPKHSPIQVYKGSLGSRDNFGSFGEMNASIDDGTIKMDMNGLNASLDN